MIASRIRRGDERPYRRWTREAALRALQELSHRKGRTFSRQDLVDALDMPSPNTVARLFGSLQDAQSASGGTPRAKHCPRRSRCRRGHPMVPGNVYIKRCSDGAVHRSCRQCTLDWCKRRNGRARVVRPDVAIKHSPAEMARYWEAAS